MHEQCILNVHNFAENSSFYFIRVNDKWEIVKENSELEKEYVNSIVKFINKKYEGLAK